MTERFNNWSGGTNGNAVSAGNTGGASGDALNSVAIGAGCTAAFDNTHTIAGDPLGLKMATGATSTTDIVGWTSVFSGLLFSASIYCYMTSYATASTSSMAFRFRTTGGTAQACRMAWNSTGTVRMLDSASSNSVSMVATCPTNALYRLDVTINVSTGSMDIWLFKTDPYAPSDANGGAWDGHVSTTGAAYGAAAIDSLDWGTVGNNANVPAWWIPFVRARDTAVVPGPSNITIVDGALAALGADSAQETTSIGVTVQDAPVAVAGCEAPGEAVAIGVTVSDSVSAALGGQWQESALYETIISDTAITGLGTSAPGESAFYDTVVRDFAEALLAGEPFAGTLYDTVIQDATVASLSNLAGESVVYGVVVLDSPAAGLGAVATETPTVGVVVLDLSQASLSTEAQESVVMDGHVSILDLPSSSVMVEAPGEGVFPADYFTFLRQARIATHLSEAGPSVRIRQANLTSHVEG